MNKKNLHWGSSLDRFLADQGIKLTAMEQEIITKGRIARRVEDLDDETLNAIANATVPLTDVIDADISKE